MYCPSCRRRPATAGYPACSAPSQSRRRGPKSCSPQALQTASSGHSRAEKRGHAIIQSHRAYGQRVSADERTTRNGNGAHLVDNDDAVCSRIKIPSVFGAGASAGPAVNEKHGLACRDAVLKPRDGVKSIHGKHAPGDKRRPWVQTALIQLGGIQLNRCVSTVREGACLHVHQRQR